MPESAASRLFGSAIDGVTCALSARFAGAAVQLNGPISVRNNSEVFRAVVTAPVPVDAALKICLIPRTVDADSSVAREQFEALERVSIELDKRGTRYCVPRPLCLLSQWGAFAMTWADGESLTQKLSRAVSIFQGAQWFEEAGAWLGNFHNAGPRRRQRVDLGDRISALREVCVTPLPGVLFANAIAKLQNDALNLSGIDVHTSWLHGDCKTDNIILGVDKVFGIDIALAHENPVEYDIAQFLNNLGLLLSSPRYIYLWGMQSRFEAAFLRGYSREGPSVCTAYLDWLRLNFLVCFWHAEVGSQRQTLRGRVLSHMFVRSVRRLYVRTLVNPPN